MQSIRSIAHFDNTFWACCVIPAVRSMPWDPFPLGGPLPAGPPPPPFPAAAAPAAAAAAAAATAAALGGRPEGPPRSEAGPARSWSSLPGSRMDPARSKGGCCPRATEGLEELLGGNAGGVEIEGGRTDARVEGGSEFPCTCNHSFWDISYWLSYFKDVSMETKKEFQNFLIWNRISWKIEKREMEEKR